MIMTYEIAQAAATDAANRQMRANGRVSWNEDDYSLACRELNRLWFDRIEAEQANTSN